MHRLHHTPREPGPKPPARLASPDPAPPRACCAHPPEPPGRGRLPQPLSGVLGRATTQQGPKQSPGVARLSLNQKPPQGPPEHSGVLAPDTGAPCPQLDSPTVLHPFSFSTPALGRPQGRSTHGGECGRCREKQEPWWGLHPGCLHAQAEPGKLGSSRSFLGSQAGVLAPTRPLENILLLH